MATAAIVTVAIVGVILVAGLIWWLETSRSAAERPVSPKRLSAAKSRLEARTTHSERLPISPNRLKGDKSVIHEFVEASRVESHEAFGIGPSQEVATTYPEAALESRLDERLRDGWELFSMEPHLVLRAAKYKRCHVDN
jgi:hypothetical protein